MKVVYIAGPFRGPNGRCAQCKETQPAENFYVSKHNKTGLSSYCRPCSKLRAKGYKARWRGSERGRQEYRRNWLKRYGLTEDTYQAIFTRQGGMCPCCGIQFNSTADACVDHCHVTGKVRGLLCRSCNLALGYAADCPTRLRALARYVDPLTYKGECAA